MERRSKKGIALMNIASNMHFTARSAMPCPHETDRRGYNECLASITWTDVM
jgi:hypothetical protein